MKILLVDDDEMILELLSSVLKKEGYEAHVSCDAGSAMALLNENGHYDLVITDIIMPGEDGTKLAQRIKEKEPTIPVVAITGGVENAAGDYQHLADMFTDGSLSKPFKPEELLAEVNRLTATEH